MEENTDLARGICHKAVAKPRWERITQELNSLGPPTRSSDAWQRVWNDLKYKTKKKSAHNHAENLATGGGPNNTVPLSNLEETVNRLMSYTTYNNPPGEEFGIENNDDNESVTEVEIYSDHDIPGPSRNVIPSREHGRNSSSNPKRREEKQIALLERQTDQQAEFQKETLATLKEMKQSLSNIEVYTKKTYYIKKDKFAIYKQEMESKRRDRKAKLELKKKLLEIKQNMYKNC
ncbi:PREDICTED: uncharacterized protein LOC108359074 [Rhagoletis zephyria]|uniref:uncharacterized protein LOC108359074 n=1 Tax=Rhagoletis zephyria TaxID=28612 RepID=UPI0008113B1A|nr:PREDICTED: uncharacterized protein LOC108359074 [Rhagoletis zephyria]